MTAEVLTCAEVSERVKFAPRTVRDLVARGAFPPPIDATLGKKLWRWSSVAVDAWAEGTWKRDAA